MQPAIFIDRDGVIIENRDLYVRSWADVEILPGALEALREAAGNPHKIVIITNQAAIGKGLVSHETVREINARLKSIIEGAGGRVDGVYLCPHTAEESCMCRKPEPGLLIQAAKDLSIDLAESVMIGDALTDIQAGQRAGVRQSILVLTGRGAQQSRLEEASRIGQFLTCKDLREAISCLLARSPK